MFDLHFRSKFVRKVRKLTRRNGELRSKVDAALAMLRMDPFDRSLQTHKATNPEGDRVFSSKVTGDLRITWDFLNGAARILDIGGHSGRRRIYR